MLHYITSWARNPRKHNLRQFQSAVVKSEYVIETLKSIAGTQTVKVLSLAQTLHQKWYWAPRTIEHIDENEIDETIPSLGSPLRLFRRLNVVIQNVFLLWYLLFKVKKDDTVLMYHSYSYATAMIIAHKLRKLPFILEVEEIYQNINQLSPRLQKAEYDVFSCASAYIFSSTLLNDIVNIHNRPAVISHGTYKVEHDRRSSFVDDKIHVVYAGTFNPRKGGALAAAGLTCLPSNYHVHIIGQGTNGLIKQIKDKISSGTTANGALVTCDGFYSGEEYIRFIQACDIGLSTQNPDAAFNDTSFPSKVLSYMANGLHVVSVRIRAVETSAVGDMITYYDEQKPESIAKAIMSVDLSQTYDSRNRIAELDEQFRQELKRLIETK